MPEIVGSMAEPSGPVGDPPAPVPQSTGLWQPFRENRRTRVDCLPFHASYADLLHNAETLSYLLRSYTVWEMTCGALGHPGGSFSEIELLSVLYSYVLRFDPREPSWPMRDVFYLSKAHACPALYTALALFGYLPLEQLRYYGRWDSGL